MKLVLVDAGQEKASFELGQGGNLIGRWDPDSKAFPEIDLEEHDRDNLVSRQHAMLTIKSDGIQLSDLGSTNGTFLFDGRRLGANEPVSIQVGSEFLVGNLRFKLV